MYRSDMSRTVTLLRHGETEANMGDLWQGQGDSPLSVNGQLQVEHVAKRLAPTEFDLIVSSDLGRTRATAGALNRSVEFDASWREANLGWWEGRPKAETHDSHDEFVTAVKAGEDPPLGESGERLSEVSSRVNAALRRVADRLDDGQRALVVCHGGVIQAAAQSILRAQRPPTGLINTSLTTFGFGDEWEWLEVFNDAAHLPSTDPRGATEVLVIRHGQSEGNVAERWQGRHDGQLTATGRDQARRLAALELYVSRVVSSPLSRALDTATAVANGASVELDIDEDLVEFDFGEWENLTADEIERGWPDEWHQFRTLGADVPRGRTGERFTDGAARLRRVIDRVVAAHPQQRTAVVSHGGVSRAYLTDVLHVAFSDRHRFSQLRNTAMATFSFQHEISRMSRWNVAPHLDL